MNKPSDVLINLLNLYHMYNICQTSSESKVFPAIIDQIIKDVDVIKVVYLLSLPINVCNAIKALLPIKFVSSDDKYPFT